MLCIYHLCIKIVKGISISGNIAEILIIMDDLERVVQDNVKLKGIDPLSYICAKTVIF